MADEVFRKLRREELLCVDLDRGIYPALMFEVLEGWGGARDNWQRRGQTREIGRQLTREGRHCSWKDRSL